MAKQYQFGIQASTQTSYANNGVTTLLGRMFSKTVAGSVSIGNAMNGFIDCQTVAGFTPQAVYLSPNTGRLFILSTASIAPSVGLWTFNITTGSYSYVGKIIANLPNVATTTHTIRGFAVNDTVTNFQVVIATTASVLINGGAFVAYAPLSFFTAGGTQIYAASGSGQTAIYLLQGYDYVGVNHNWTTLWGGDIAYLSSNAAYNTKLYVLNNTIAAPQVGAWDLAITPTVAGLVTNGVTSLTGGYSSATYGVSTACYCQMSSLNGYQLGAGADQVAFMNGTAAVPTGLTAWSAGTLQTTSNVFFTRDCQLVYTFTTSAISSPGITAGATYTATGVNGASVTVTFTVGFATNSTTIIANTTNQVALNSSGTLTLASGTGPASITYSSYTSLFYFNLAATSGGAAITTITTASGFTMLRAFGISNNTFYARTPVAGLSPALTLTLLQANSISYAKPISTPANSALAGNDCIAIGESTGMAMGKISDLFFSVSGTSAASTITTSNTTGIVVGMAVVGPGIAAGTTVSSLVANTSITLSAAVIAPQGSSQVFYFGASNWSSLTQINNLGSGTDVVVPSNASTRYGAQGLPTDVDRFAYISYTSTALFKPMQANVISGVIGGIAAGFAETNNPAYVDFGATAAAFSEFRAGWLFLCATGTGQRGVYFIDVLSDRNFGYSAIITPVMQVPSGATLRTISAEQAPQPFPGQYQLWLRSASTNGSTFSSGAIPTPSSPGNWTAVNDDYDYLNSISLNSYVQSCFTPIVIGSTAVSNQYPPAQVIDISVTANVPGETSDYWVWSVDHSSLSGSSPMEVSVVQVTPYVAAPSSGLFRLVGFDINGNQVYSVNTTSQPSQFQVSGNNGTSYSSWVSMANFISSFNTSGTTEIKVSIPNPPVVPVVRWSFLDV